MYYSVLCRCSSKQKDLSLTIQFKGLPKILTLLPLSMDGSLSPLPGLRVDQQSFQATKSNPILPGFKVYQQPNPIQSNLVLRWMKMLSPGWQLPPSLSRKGCSETQTSSHPCSVLTCTCFFRLQFQSLRLSGGYYYHSSGGSPPSQVPKPNLEVRVGEPDSSARGSNLFLGGAAGPKGAPPPFSCPAKPLNFPVGSFEPPAQLARLLILAKQLSEKCWQRNDERIK